jgi:hypothetical protein
MRSIYDAAALATFAALLVGTELADAKPVAAFPEAPPSSQAPAHLAAEPYRQAPAYPAPAPYWQPPVYDPSRQPAAFPVAAPARDASPSDETAQLWKVPRISVQLHLGVGAPTGFAGAVLEASPTAWLAFGAGAGLGGDGRQLAGMGRFRLPIGRFALGVGGGYSVGAYQPESCRHFDCPYRAWSPAHWLNSDLSVEMRRAGGIEWRIYGGNAVTLNDANVCHNLGVYPDASSGCRGAGHLVIYAGASVGYGFDL